VARALELREGARVVCPKCGRVGTLKVDSFKAGGKEYKYWVVRHGTKRCILKRFEEPRKAQPPALSLPQEREEEARSVGVAVESFPRELQRRAWYIVKLSSSVGALKENPSQENLQKLKNTAGQVTERLGVATATLLEAAERFIAAKTDAAKMRLNEELTLTACRILSSLPVEEKREKGREVAAPVLVALSSLEANVGSLAEKVDALSSLVAGFKRIEEEVGALSEKISTLSSLPATVQTLEEKVSALSVEQLAEEVAKRIPLTAISRQKTKGLRKMILEVLSDGKERKSDEIQEELKKRFKVEVSESSLTGRLSELTREGLLARERKGGASYYRLAGRG